MKYDHVIIGTGIAGTGAAEVIRQRQPEASILLVGNESHRLYSRVLLPHLIRGKAEETVFLKKADFYVQQRIETAFGVTATKIEPQSKTVHLSDGRAVEYGKLLIATGGAARRLDCPGADAADPLSFQTLDDARRIAASMTGSAVVVGGGFIALELLMSFAHHGIPATVVVRGDGFFSRTLDPEGRKRVMDVIRAQGIEIKTRAEVIDIETDGARKVIHLDTSESLDCTALGVGIGLDLSIAWLQGSGIEVAKGVVTNDRLETNVPDVFAAGDVAEYEDTLAGRRHVVGNWTNALLQGKHAGLMMTGENRPFEALTSYHIACFGLPIGFFGATGIENSERIVRKCDNGSILQFFVSDSRVIAATCVGPLAERPGLTALLSSKKNLSERELTALADSSIPLASLVG